MKNLKNYLICLLFPIICLSCNNLNKNNKNNENHEEIKKVEVLDFVHIKTIPTSEPILTGEYMSKLNLDKFKIFTVKVLNKNGIEPDEKAQTLEILGYETLKGCYNQKYNSQNNQSDFKFVDSSGYCVETVYFSDNLYDKKPECTYQILSSRKFVYEKEKGNIPFQLVYPHRLLRLCK